jgi:hypothetical protein
MTKEEAADLVLRSTRGTIGEYQEACITAVDKVGEAAGQIMPMIDYSWALLVSSARKTVKKERAKCRE